MNEKTAPSGELTDEQIDMVWRKNLVANAQAVRRLSKTEERFARAIIAADRALRASPAAVPCKICWADEPHTGTCGSNDPQALCNQQPVKQSDAQAALAAKDADYALGVSMLTKKIAALTAERDAAMAASRYETDLCGQALADLKEMTAKLDALHKDAERYRWLKRRDLPWLYTDHPKSMVVTRWHSGHSPDEIDAAIDAAMTKEPK